MASEELRPTALGMKAMLLFASILVSFYAIPYTNLLFLMMSFLGTIGVLGAWWTHRNLRGLKSHVISIEAAPAHAGHDIRFHLDPSGRLRFQTALTLKISGSWHVVDKVGMVTEPMSGLGRLEGLQRGIHAVEDAALVSTFPFGILSARRRITTPEEVIAYPEPLDLSQSPQSRLSKLLGKEGVDGDLSGLREFRPGDALRSIHWKASARRRDFVVKEMEGNGQENLEVVLDRRCHPKDFELALSTLSTLALFAAQNDKPLTIHSQGLSSTYGAYHRPVHECLVWLASTQPLDKDAPPPPPVSQDILRLPETRRA